MNHKLIIIFCLIFSVSSFKSLAFAAEKDSVEWKTWSAYSDEEKDSLRSRWTKEKIQEIVDSLKAGKPLPGEKIPVEVLGNEYLDKIYDEDFDTYNMSERSYDLRGISLTKLNLEDADLRFVHLAGANLQETILNKANLREANLNHANLSGAKLTEADLQGANLKGAILIKTFLDDANLREAKLIEVDLQGAWLRNANLEATEFGDVAVLFGLLGGGSVEEPMYVGANLKDANLYGANLQGSILVGANLDGTNLYNAYFGNTLVKADQLEKARDYRYIRPGEGVMPWFKSMGLFDSGVDNEKLEIYENFHRELKIFCEREGMDEMAAHYHFWENEMKTLRSPWSERILRLIFLKWSFGYGSRPMWILRNSIISIVCFAIIFAIFTLPRRTKSGIYLVQSENDAKKEILLSWRSGRLLWDCLYFSLLSFATFGYGAIQPRQWLEFFRLQPLEYKPIGWARIFVGIEAASGIYLFALLATILFGRA